MFLKQHHNAFFPLVAEQIVVLVGCTLGPWFPVLCFSELPWKRTQPLSDRMLNNWSSDCLLRQRKRIPFGKPWPGLLNIQLFSQVLYCQRWLSFYFFPEIEMNQKCNVAYHLFVLQWRLGFETVSWPWSSSHESDFRFYFTHSF